MKTPFETEAMIHSLKDKDMVTIIEHINSNNVLALYKGMYCTAVYNEFTGLYYVDDDHDTKIAYKELLLQKEKMYPQHGDLSILSSEDKKKFNDLNRSIIKAYAQLHNEQVYLVYIHMLRIAEYNPQEEIPDFKYDYIFSSKPVLAKFEDIYIHNPRALFDFTGRYQPEEIVFLSWAKNRKS